MSGFRRERRPPNPPEWVSWSDGGPAAAKGSTAPQDGRPQSPRCTVGGLFSDPRHFRGDCRLLRTAVRRGWLADVPQADRDALVRRFEEAQAERQRRRGAGPDARAEWAACRTVLELARAELDSALRALRFPLAGTPAGQCTGRPRECWHVSDYPTRIDANELRRRAKADGADLRSLHAINVRHAGLPAGASERVSLSVVPDPRYGWRVWLLCPRCGGRRLHLYPTRGGVRCRRCGCIRHAGWDTTRG